MHPRPRRPTTVEGQLASPAKEEGQRHVDDSDHTLIAGRAMKPGTSLVWSLPADATAPARARGVVNGRVLNHVDPAVREMIALLVSEIVTNSIRHAGLTGEDEIECRLEEGETIHVEVWDPGPGYPGGPVAPRPDGSGGWGLMIVDQVATRWGVRGARPACVWFDLDPVPH
jgi:anti-sigma regulatory factor (Ser/Thr protein kinase)